MGRLLLTSSQVSIVLSSSIIVIFTFLLFLAGYILQQQSVERLHATLRPQQPSPRHGAAVPTIARPDPRSRLSRPLGRLGEQIHWKEPTKFNWSKYAHAQLAREPEELCHALIVLYELNRLQSAAPRLLMFPRNWIEHYDDSAEDMDPEMDRAIQMLKKASRRYRAILVPIDPMEKGADETDPNSYSIASAFSLTNYDRVMMLPNPGLILDAKKLDSMLAFFEPTEISTYPLLHASTSSPQSMLLIKPSKDTFTTLSTEFSKSHASDNSLLREAFPSHEPLLSPADLDFQPTLYTTLEDMRRPMTSETKFNVTNFSEETVFVSLTDSDLPGPQYDIPYQMIVSHRPKDEDQGFVWEKMYSTYKDRRYRVCGMDLIDWKRDDDIKTELK